MNSFLIYTNSDKDKGFRFGTRVAEYLESKGARAVVCGDMSAASPKEADAVIVLGGDGTMLRAARELGNEQLPMLGINLGTLGFLAEIEKTNIYEALDRLLKDDYELEERMMIQGTVGNREFHALNDIVVSRSGGLRIIGLSMYVNGQLLDTYEADGVIISTPTGSTGYNLSAGGPIVSPKTGLIIVTPICPHSLTTKSAVFDASDNITIEVMKQRKKKTPEAMVAFDGENDIELRAGELIDIKLSNRVVKLIKMYDVSFYKVLRDKIGGR